MIPGHTRPSFDGRRKDREIQEDHRKDFQEGTAEALIEKTAALEKVEDISQLAALLGE